MTTGPFKPFDQAVIEATVLAQNKERAARDSDSERRAPLLATVHLVCELLGKEEASGGSAWLRNPDDSWEWGTVVGPPASWLSFSRCVGIRVRLPDPDEVEIRIECRGDEITLYRNMEEAMKLDININPHLEPERFQRLVANRVFVENRLYFVE